MGAVAVTLVLAAAQAGTAVAQEASAGRDKARPCAACHGEAGLSVAPDAPNLAGQPAIYLAAQLRAYKSGKRSHEVMSVMAKPLSERDIDDLAAWFASIKVEAQPPK